MSVYDVAPQLIYFEPSTSNISGERVLFAASYKGPFTMAKQSGIYPFGYVEGWCQLDRWNSLRLGPQTTVVGRFPCEVDQMKSWGFTTADFICGCRRVVNPDMGPLQRHILGAYIYQNVLGGTDSDPPPLPPYLATHNASRIRQKQQRWGYTQAPSCLVANRSGKPKGSKNRSTLRKLGQLQDEKPASHLDDRVWIDSMSKSSLTMSPASSCMHQDIDVNAETKSLGDTSQRQLSESPRSQGSNLVSSSMVFPEPGTEYPPPFGDTFTTDPPFTQGSMSPTFLQKEFITKGLTSFPLAVHVPSTFRPTCDCGETLVFYLNRLRHMVANPAQVRFDQMLQGIHAALSVCREFLRCPGGHRDNTNLLLCTSTLDISLQILDYWMSYELLPAPMRDQASINAVVVGYGEYDMEPEETRRIRRFLLRRRLIQCKEILGVLRETAEINAEGDVGEDRSDGAWLQQLLAGSEAMTDTFLQTMSDGTCICR